MGMLRRLRSHRQTLNFLCIGLLVALVSAASRANEPNEKMATPSVETVLRQTIDFYRQATSISVVIEQKQDFGELEIDSTWTIDFEKPNRLKLRVNQQSFLPVLTAVNDGKTLYLLVAALRKYTAAGAPKAVRDVWSRIDDVMKVPFMQSVLQMPLVIDLCLSAPPYQKVMKADNVWSYEGLDTIDGGKAHHLKFKDDKYDWELWITAKGDPVVRRAVVDLKRAIAEAGAAKIERAKVIQDFTNWKFNQKLDENAFVFQPPKSSRKVDKIVQEPGDEVGPHPLVGERAPDVKLKRLEKGEFRLEEFRGAQVVILDFWATWCEPCSQELPILAEVAARYKDKGVVFCGINEDDEPEDVRKFLREQKLDFSVALDGKDDVAERYAVADIPMLVLIGKNGIVQSVHVGYDPSIKATLQKELDALLAGKDLATEALTNAQKSGGSGGRLP